MDWEPSASNRRGPFLEMVVQPQSKFRFRYKSEMTGRHGSLLGQEVESFASTPSPSSSSTISKSESVTVQSKVFPTVKLHNFLGEAVIRVSLVCETIPHYPHPHVLEMGSISTNPEPDHVQAIQQDANANPARDSMKQVEVPVSGSNDFTAVFQGLNIIYVSKKDCRRVLQEKMSQIEDPWRKVGAGQLDDLILSMNLNVVALHFEAFTRGQNDQMLRICPPIISTPIQHNKSTQTGELRITRIDRVSGCCTGNDEVFILVEKVDKHNIQVKFYEETEKGLEIWKAYATFSKSDVHHQYAIVFKTPAYRSLDIDFEVDVWIQLERPSDGQTSNRIKFRYKPQERSSTNIRQGALSSSFSKISFPCDTTSSTMEEDDTKSKALAMSVALSICQGLHQWAETSDFGNVLQKLRHLLCLVNQNGDNALHSAIIHGQRDPFIQCLETLSAFPDTASVINEPNAEGLTPLHLALMANRMDFISELVRRDADVSVQDSEGETPIHIAVKSNDIPCVKCLLQANNAEAAMNKLNYSGMSPLMVAVANGFNEIVDILCANKASLTEQEGTYGRTPLHFACEKETKESIISTMIILKSAGKNVDEIANLQNYRGDTALHVAASSGFTTICALLMNSGADPMIENHVRKEAEDEDEDVNSPKEDESEKEERLSGQTVFDVAVNEQVLRVLKGTEDDWEIILKSLVFLPSSPLSHDKDKEFLQDKGIDSGIDVNSSSYTTSQFLNSSSSNQL